MWTFHRDAPDLKRRAPYKCKNWRCLGNDGECSTFDRRLTYARVKEAIERDKLTPDGWVFFVLTLDRNGHYEGGRRRWKDADDAFGSLSRMHRKFFERARHWMGSERIAKRERRPVMKPFGREWVATVEAHRSGWPHVNVLVWAPELAEYVEREQERLGDEFQRIGLHRAALPPELDRLARAAGWGAVSTVERVKSQDKVLNYLAKLSGESGRAVAEIAKLTQLPRNAPQKFRRLRAGKGWLPPRRKDGNITGSIMIRKYDDDGTPLVLPVQTVRDPLLVKHLPSICYEETKLWDRERENAAALRRALAELELPMLPANMITDDLVERFEAERRAHVAELYRELGTPLALSVLLRVPDDPPPVIATGPPPATAPPELEPDPQLGLFDVLFDELVER